MIKKTIHYRRIEWDAPNHPSFTDFVEPILMSLGGSIIGPCHYTDQLDFVVEWRQIQDHRVFLKFVTYEQGADAAVLAHVNAETTFLDTGTISPPNDADFIESQLFCLIEHNNIVWISHNSPLRQGPILALLRRLLEDFGVDDESLNFFLQASLDQSVVRRMLHDGVSEIDLGLGAFKATLEMLLDNEAAYSGPLRSLLTTSMSADDIEAMANVSGRLTLKPGRAWSLSSVKSILGAISENVIDQHEDEFVIVTKNNVRLTREKMTISRSAEINGDRRTLPLTEVIAHFQTVLNDLIATGITEQ